MENNCKCPDFIAASDGRCGVCAGEWPQPMTTPTDSGIVTDVGLSFGARMAAKGKFAWREKIEHLAQSHYPDADVVNVPIRFGDIRAIAKAVALTRPKYAERLEYEERILKAEMAEIALTRTLAEAEVDRDQWAQLAGAAGDRNVVLINKNADLERTLADERKRIGELVPIADVVRLLDESVERWSPSGGDPAYIEGYETGVADACLWLAEDVRDLPSYFAKSEAHRASLSQRPTDGADR